MQKAKTKNERIGLAASAAMPGWRIQRQPPISDGRGRSGRPRAVWDKSMRHL